MTKKEAQEKSQEKVAQIESLARMLQVELSAKQVINPKTGVIENKVFYTDYEKYDIEKPGEEKKEEATPEPVSEEGAPALEENHD